MFWVLIVISGLCAAGYMTVLFWERYISNPTRTTILTSYAPTTTIPFPAVTFCNVNRILHSKVEQFLKILEFNKSEEQIIRNAIPQLLAFTHPNYDNYNMSELKVLQTVLERNNYYNITVVLEAVSQGCHEMLVHCVWNKKNISCLENFRISFSNNGFCCSFNYEIGKKHPTLYSSYSGLSTGLKVLLNPMIQMVHYSSLYSAGFKAFIHYPTEYPGQQANSKILSPGKVSYLQVIGIKTICSQDVKDLPINHRNCLYPDEFRLKYFGQEYSDSNCLVECEEQMYFKICGCVPFYFAFSDKPICDISKIPCLQGIRLNNSTTRRERPCVCYSQCEDTFYNVMSTSTRMAYRESMSMLKFTNIDIAEDSVLVNIFFLSNTHTILQRNSITSTIYLLCNEKLYKSIS